MEANQSRASTSSEKDENSSKDKDLQMAGLKTPSPKKRMYTSIFNQPSTTDSDASDSEFTPNKEQKCEGILENLIKSEICKMNQKYKIRKGIGKKKLSKNESNLSDSAGECQGVNTSAQTSTSSVESANITEEQYNSEDGEVPEKSLLSPEEHERYASIAKELDILNTHGTVESCSDTNAKLYTGPYGRILSPFKKFSSFKSFSRGVKRSPRKLPVPVLKRPKLQEQNSSSSCSNSDLSSPEKVPEKLFKKDTTPTDESSEDSMDHDLRIVEESENEGEFDKELTVKSEKFSLSTINVKSILHKIITNENVVEMVRKAVHEEIEEKDGKFEPKMTRSKVKQVLETQGSVPHMWGISPRKLPVEASSFLDIELPEEEEDDEDFNPETVTHDSDEDSESVVSSSCLSDLDSTLPSTPTTPVGQSIFQRAQTPTNTDTENSQSLLSPMGPPLQIKVPRSQHKASSLGQKYQSAMERDEERKKAEEEELIAYRTRSKFPLNDLSVFDIEANFVAPDITEDLYDTTCDNSEWQHFLFDLVKPDDKPVTEDSLDPVTEEEDPEYNYLEEAEQEAYDREDFRDDRAVKVSRKELKSLIGELYDTYGDNDPVDAECRKSIKAQSQKVLETSNKKKETEIQQTLMLQVGDHERRQIDDQMRKHVQLLTQTFVMAQSDKEEHKAIAITAQTYLNEIKRFADMSEKVYASTAYRTCNLEHAIGIIQDPSWTEKSSDKEEGSSSILFKYESLLLPSLNCKQMNTLWTSPCFMYPELLPHGGFFEVKELKKDRARVKFLEAEDNLLAMGLEQFKHLGDSTQYIHQFMLPSKSKKQIHIRIKNLNAKAAKDNPVKFWKLYKQSPITPQYAPEFDISMMKAVKDQEVDVEDLPYWCKSLVSDDTEKQVNSRPPKPKRRRQSTSFSVTSTGITALYLAPASSSAPVTPSGQQTDSSHKSSSGSSVESSTSEGHVRKRRQISGAHRKRLLGAHRKKLDLSMKAGKASSGGFIPLTMPSQSNPITICVVDNIPSSVSNPSLTTSVVTNTMTGVTTCVAPTIIFINNSLPVQPKISQSTSVTSVPSITTKMSSTAGTSQKGKSTDTLQAALISSNILSATASPIKNDTPYCDSTLEEDAGDSTNLSVIKKGESEAEESSVVTCNSTASNQAEPLNTSTSVLDSSCASASPSALDSKPVYETIPTKSPGSTDVHSCSNEFTESGVCGSGDAPISLTSDTPEPQTPESMNSSTEGTPKSAIEIMASYAPYFISPRKRETNLSALQQQQETTPKKSDRNFRQLVPKPTPPSGEKPSNFKLEKTQKRHSSPRKRELNLKARSILPKGFVPSTFDISPTKRAASSLIDKAKQMQKKPSKYGNLLEGFRKILPQPQKSETVMSPGSSSELQKEITKASTLKMKKFNDHVGKKDKINTEKDAIENLDVTGGLGDENAVDGDDGVIDDKCGDTESDYTQSEDGNDTQEDSQEDIDSQEEEPDEDDTHIANLMQASTTNRSDFYRDEASKARICKKDRDRDISLAMLAPDIIESDPQRDYRDTAFAQAYLHKVKKTLRDDMDTLEKFLQLMYNFSKTTESPVKLYKDLDVLLVEYPGLMKDFAGFLLPEQAIECDCYETHQEFHMARTFLRKLEIYFNKAPHQFQKVMKTFSRWYRKSGRKVKDLREQVEPMLKGQQNLLQDFSRFFDDEAPPESAMDDFEEVTLEESDEEKYDSFEEVELLDDDQEEVLGTKRCPCQCHNTGDDTYRKKKKHCYRCCLTVIDGELVYRINKSTIKRINVTYGPSVRVTDVISASSEEDSPLKDDKTTRSEEDGCTDLEPITREESIMTDWLDSRAAEKENIEHYQTSRPAASPQKQEKVKKASQRNKAVCETGSKPTFLQRMTKLPRPPTSDKPARLSDMVNPTSKAQSHKGASDHSQIRPQSETQALPTTTVEAVSEVNGRPQSKFPCPQPIVCTNQTVPQRTTPTSLHVAKLNESEVHSQEDSAFGGSLNMSGPSTPANDILATDFNSALMTEVSMDSVSMPFLIQGKSPEKNVRSAPNVAAQFTGVNSLSAGLVIPAALPMSSDNHQIPETSTPSGVDKLNLSKDSLFSKVECRMIEDISTRPCQIVQNTLPENDNVTNNMNVEEPNSASKSPSFSPFSPHASEVQAITSVPSPLASITSPGAKGQAGRVSSMTKVRRITPIQVSESSQHSQSSFKSVVENSPLICDSTIIGSPFEKFGKDDDESRHKQCTSSDTRQEGSIKDSNISEIRISSESSNTQTSTSQTASQRSDSTLKSANSDSTEVPVCNIKISEPVMFSEDANEEFPAAPSTAGKLLSEESLLHCFGKHSQFDEHMSIHSISNLTNILHALEEKPVQKDYQLNKQCQVSQDSSSQKERLTTDTQINVQTKAEENGSGKYVSGDKGDGSETKSESASTHTSNYSSSSDSSNETVTPQTDKNIDLASGSSFQGVQINTNLDSQNSGGNTSSLPGVSGDAKSCLSPNVVVGVMNANIRKTCERKVENYTDSASVVINPVQYDAKGDKNTEGNGPNICDSELEKNKKAKDKHKRLKEKAHKKEHKHDERHSRNLFDRMKKLSCSTVVGDGVTLDVAAVSTSSEQQQDSSIVKPTTETDTVSDAQQACEREEAEYQSAESMTAAELCSNISSPSSSTEGPEWSKDTDKTILEACKNHGIREKTFVKIAKQIGNVTPKQVRKRFGQLYKLILKPMSKHTGKNTISPNQKDS